jgi:hypothetical protein
VDSLDIDTSPRSRPKADEGVTALYAAHAVGLIRLGFVMLGDRRDRAAAERQGQPPFDSAEAAATEIQTEPPLRLPPVPVPAPGARRRPVPRRWIRWGAPLTAAAAVVALAISLVLIKGIPNGSVVPPTATSSTSTGVDSVPRYYVAITRGGGIVAGDSVTGQTLGRIAPPPGLTFTSVTAAADDRTFVVFAVTPSPPRCPGQAGNSP